MSPLDEFVASESWSRIESAAAWTVRRDPHDGDRVLVDVRATDGELYTALCLCDGYPKRAPSVAFIDAAGDKSVATAWPRGTREFHQEVKAPPEAFICMPLTREGLAHHRGWPSENVGAWDPSRHTLIDVLNRLQRLVTGPHYLGRGGRR